MASHRTTLESVSKAQFLAQRQKLTLRDGLGLETPCNEAYP